VERKNLNNRFVEDFVVNWKNNGFLEDFVEIWKSWRWNSNFLNSNCFGVRSCNERGYICLSEIVISGSFTSSGICMLLYVFRVCSLWKRFLGLWFVCFCLCVFVCLSVCLCTVSVSRFCVSVFASLSVCLCIVAACAKGENRFLFEFEFQSRN